MNKTNHCSPDSDSSWGFLLLIKELLGARVGYLGAALVAVRDAVEATAGFLGAVLGGCCFWWCFGCLGFLGGYDYGGVWCHGWIFGCCPLMVAVRDVVGCYRGGGWCQSWAIPCFESRNCSNCSVYHAANSHKRQRKPK